MKKGNKFIDILLISLLIILTGALIFSVFSTVEMFKTSKFQWNFGLIKNQRFLTMSENQEKNNLMPARISRMSLTAFDRQLALEFMDKNHDGRCDICGMPVEQCIDSGQLECNMDPNAKIGVLGSQHIHADWKVYIGGKALDFSDKSHMERMQSNQPVSSFIHVDSGAPAPEKTGDILHMHATGVPLWLFFKSIDMDFNKDCIILENKEKYCSDENKELKFFVNGKESNEFENYAFNDLDKILISYEDESEEEIKN